MRANFMRQAAKNPSVAPTAISRQIENLGYHFSTPVLERSAREGLHQSRFNVPHLLYRAHIFGIVCALAR